MALLRRIIKRMRSLAAPVVEHEDVAQVAAR
jgi:hypothetical protein